MLFCCLRILVHLGYCRFVIVLPCIHKLIVHEFTSNSVQRSHRSCKVLQKMKKNQDSKSSKFGCWSWKILIFGQCGPEKLIWPTHQLLEMGCALVPSGENDGLIFAATATRAVATITVATSSLFLWYAKIVNYICSIVRRLVVRCGTFPLYTQDDSDVISFHI